MFKANDSCRLISRTRQASTFRVKATTGVAVRRFTEPSHAGASPSSTNISASREGTISVGFREVVIAMIAPIVTRVAAAHGRYRIATSVMGVALDWILANGKTPNATRDIRTKINAVRLMPRRKTIGSRRVLSLVSPAVWASDSNPA